MATHWCREHKVTFFKKGKMRGYAHPITDEEGEPTGEWCNEEEEKEMPKEAIKPVPAQTIEPRMSRDDWTEKDKITRKSIERQTALNAAVEVAELVQKGGDNITTEKIISTAKRFELYLETGIDVAAQLQKQEVTGAKTSLVAAIKAAGGKVVAEAQKEGG